jgi:hypothetical protein
VTYTGQTTPPPSSTASVNVVPVVTAKIPTTPAVAAPPVTG